MNKEDLRKQFFNLKLKGHSYTQCVKILNAMFSFKVNSRTLKRWVNWLDKGNWDLKDLSKKD